MLELLAPLPISGVGGTSTAMCMRLRPGQWWFVASALAFALAAPAAAQSQRPTGVISVSATVVRSCSVDVSSSATKPVVAVPSPSAGQLDPAVQVRCGSDLVTYPSASAASASIPRSVLPSVTVSGTNRVTIEF